MKVCIFSCMLIVNYNFVLDIGDSSVACQELSQECQLSQDQERPEHPCACQELREGRL